MQFCDMLRSVITVIISFVGLSNSAKRKEKREIEEERR
jgi:hypothetical protein